MFNVKLRKKARPVGGRKLTGEPLAGCTAVQVVLLTVYVFLAAVFEVYFLSSVNVSGGIAITH